MYYLNLDVLINQLLPPSWRALRELQHGTKTVSETIMVDQVRNRTAAEFNTVVNDYIVNHTADLQSQYGIPITEEIQNQLQIDIYNQWYENIPYPAENRVPPPSNEVIAMTYGLIGYFESETTITEQVPQVVNNEVPYSEYVTLTNGKFHFLKSILKPFKDLLNDFEIYRRSTVKKINLSAETGIIEQQIQRIIGINQGVYILDGVGKSFSLNIPIVGQANENEIKSFLKKTLPIGRKYDLIYY